MARQVVIWTEPPDRAPHTCLRSFGARHRLCPTTHTMTRSVRKSNNALCKSESNLHRVYRHLRLQGVQTQHRVEGQAVKPVAPKLKGLLGLLKEEHTSKITLKQESNDLLIKMRFFMLGHVVRLIYRSPSPPTSMPASTNREDRRGSSLPAHIDRSGLHNYPLTRYAQSTRTVQVDHSSEKPSSAASLKGDAMKYS